MLFVYQSDCAADHITKQDLLDFRRLQCIRNQNHWIVTPTHNVNAFAGEFPRYVLDSIAAHSNACTYAIDSLIATTNGYFAAISGFSTDCVDSDDSFGDFRYLLLEQSLNQHRLGSRQDDFDAISGRLHFVNDRSNAGATVIAFTRNLFASRQNGFDVAKLNDGYATLRTLNDAGHQLTDLSVEFIYSCVPLGFLEFLNNHLFGRLGADTANFVFAETSSVHCGRDTSTIASD